jgi:hypothetical protein
MFFTQYKKVGGFDYSWITEMMGRNMLSLSMSNDN